MDRTEILTAARSALEAEADRFAALVAGAADLGVALGGTSGWTARDAAVHIGVGSNLYAEVATGVPSPYADPTVAGIAASNEALMADVAETDPGKLAALALDGIERFLRATAGRPGDQLTPWHFGRSADIADLTAILVGELNLHGFDVASALRVAWPVDPAHAVLALGTYAGFADLLLSPAATAGHTAAYGIELRGGPAFTARFADGALTVEAPGGEVDCVLSADPAALFLTLGGRMPRWPAFALGLLAAGGEHPELAYGFHDLFLFP